MFQNKLVWILNNVLDLENSKISVDIFIPMIKPSSEGMPF